MTDAGKLIAFLNEPGWLVCSVDAFYNQLVRTREPPFKVESAREIDGSGVDVMLLDTVKGKFRYRLVIEGIHGVRPSPNPNISLIRTVTRVTFNDKPVRASASIKPAVTIGRVREP